MNKKTRIIKINPDNIDLQKIKIASNLLKKGEVVAFPTETVYGLGAAALNENAIKKIFEIKNRPSDNPLIVHIAHKSEVSILAKEISNSAKKLIDFFWPGPLTIILKKRKIVPDITTSNLENVAIRMPSNKIAIEIIKNAKTPIAAPSANSFSKPSPTLAKHVFEDLNGKLKLIIDAGQTDIGIESTVIDMTQKTPVLLRPGGISPKQIEKIIGKIKIHPLIKNKKLKNFIASSPGMKYKHYSPSAPIILVRGEKQKAKDKIKQIIKKQNKKIGIITFNKNNDYQAYSIKYLGSDKKEIAKNLFKTFREFDDEKVDLIISESINNKELGLGIMNRLKKAATKIVKI